MKKNIQRQIGGKTMGNKSIFLLIVAFFVLLACSNSFSREKLSDMEKLAIAALNEEKGWKNKYSMIATPVKKDYYERHKIMKVQVLHIAPAPIFFVAISENKKKYVFASYKDGDAEKFSKLMKDENKEIDKNTVRQYLKAFLFLVDKKSSLIEKLEDIVFVSEREKYFLIKYRNSIKPVEYRILNKGIKISFFSWSWGKIYKWDMLIKHNGEILSSKRKSLYSKSIRPIY